MSRQGGLSRCVSGSKIETPADCVLPVYVEAQGTLRCPAALRHQRRLPPPSRRRGVGDQRRPLLRGPLVIDLKRPIVIRRTLRRRHAPRQRTSVSTPTRRGGPGGGMPSARQRQPVLCIHSVHIPGV